MTQTTVGLRTAIAALAIGFLLPGTAPPAHAMATYDALAEFTLTLTGVTDTAQTPVTDGWSVIAEGSTWDSGATPFGTANADFKLDLASNTSPGTGDGVSQSSNAFGDASNGDATSWAESDLWVGLTNTSQQSLVFTFGYDATVEAMVSGLLLGREDAYASAAVQVADGQGVVDILLEAYADLAFGPPSESDSVAGNFSLTLAGGGEQSLSWMIDADGYAGGAAGSEDFALATSVPEPATIALICLGLAGYRFVRRKPIKTP